jgi:hypothetical protein
LHGVQLHEDFFIGYPNHTSTFPRHFNEIEADISF